MTTSSATTNTPGALPLAPAMSLEGISVDFGGAAPAVNEVSLTISTGGVTAIVGPNGSGKSTLLRTMGRLSAPDSGSVLLDGQDIFRRSSRQLARELGILPQSPLAPPGLTVVDLVSRGRDPHRRWFDQWSKADEVVVWEALEQTGMLSFAKAHVDDLSGGQRQRAWIAMALAQRTRMLLLDEPTTYLDIAHQLDVLELVRGMHEADGTAIVMVLHDLSMAARFADRIIALRDGRIVADGDPGDVITPALLRDVFDLEATVVTDPHTGRPHVMPIRRVDGAGSGSPHGK